VGAATKRVSGEESKAGVYPGRRGDGPTAVGPAAWARFPPVFHRSSDMLFPGVTGRMASPMGDTSMARKEEDKAAKSMGLGMALGLAIGVGIGVALGNIGMGIAIGVALGAGLGAGFGAKTGKGTGA